MKVQSFGLSFEVIVMQTKIVDSFEIKKGMVGTMHAPGVIVVFDGAVCTADQWPVIGTHLTIYTLAGPAMKAVVGERKLHGNGVSLFLDGLTTAAVPVGSVIEWVVKTANTPMISSK